MHISNPYTHMFSDMCYEAVRLEVISELACIRHDPRIENARFVFECGSCVNVICVCLISIIRIGCNEWNCIFWSEIEYFIEHVMLPTVYCVPLSLCIVFDTLKKIRQTKNIFLPTRAMYVYSEFPMRPIANVFGTFLVLLFSPLRLQISSSIFTFEPNRLAVCWSIWRHAFQSSKIKKTERERRSWAALSIYCGILFMHTNTYSILTRSKHENSYVF